MTLGSLIAGPVIGCGPADSLRNAAEVMSEHGYGALAVIDGHGLAGIITERDVVAAVSSGADPSTTKVAEWMTRNPDTASPTLEIREAAEWMLAVGYRHLPIVDGDQVVGMTSIKDILWALVDARV